MRDDILTAGQMSSNLKNQEAVKIINTLSILSASISHELKNDLSAIIMCTDIAEKQLNNIKKKATSANYLINNLQLQIKAVVAGEQNKEDFRLYSMAQNIEEALDQYYFQDHERSLIVVDLSQDFRYLGNPSLTNHILQNLIKNSLRAIKNANKGRVAVKIEPGKEFNRLIVVDTALGISKDFLPNLFVLFESQNRASGGAGVGLALVKHVMTMYGGDIICESEEGKFTKFILTFPSV